MTGAFPAILSEQACPCAWFCAGGDVRVQGLCQSAAFSEERSSSQSVSFDAEWHGFISVASVDIIVKTL